MRRPGSKLVAAVASLLALAALAWASDPPDSKINPQSRMIETVDSALVDGVYHIRHTTQSGAAGQPPTAALLTNAADNDHGARIAFSANGDAWVAWWRDAVIDGVFIRKHDFGSGAWLGETRVSAASETSRRPEILHDGGRLWIVYEIPRDDGTGIAVMGGDGVAPWPTRQVVALTKYSGDVDPRLHNSAKTVWVTWFDNASLIGWSRYFEATNSWSAPAYEPYGDGVGAAEERILAAVLAN